MTKKYKGRKNLPPPKGGMGYKGKEAEITLIATGSEVAIALEC